MFLSQSSKFGVDPLSEVLAALGARSIRRTRLEASGDWALGFPAQPRLKFVALIAGRCWVAAAGLPGRMLAPGDVFLIGDHPYVVASDPGVAPVEGAPLYAGRDTARIGDGDQVRMLGGGVAFADGAASFFLDALPRFLAVDGAEPGAAGVARSLAWLDAELEADRPGAALVAARLAELLLVEAIRAHVAADGPDRTGWIGALGDPHVGAALRLMHGEVARPWTVGVLAAQVGMSRSAFAARFAEQVGKPPLDYLTRWRMESARRMLREGRRDIARVAEEVGYSSQSAFGHAYKRTFGHSPRLPV